jgi:hypothetical protein
VAAFRSGKTGRAADALHRLSAMTHASGTDWALGIKARSRARLSDGDTAERLYLEAIGRTRIRVELARAHLPVANGCAGMRNLGRGPMVRTATEVWGPRLGSGYAALGNAIGCAYGAGDSKRVASVARSPAPPTTT